MTVDINFWKSMEPEELLRAIADEENRRHVEKAMQSLTIDPVYSGLIIEQVESKRIELRCFISWLARELQPRNFLNEDGIVVGATIATIPHTVHALERDAVSFHVFDPWQGYQAHVRVGYSICVEEHRLNAGIMNRSTQPVIIWQLLGKAWKY